MLCFISLSCRLLILALNSIIFLVLPQLQFQIKTTSWNHMDKDQSKVYDC